MNMTSKPFFGDSNPIRSDVMSVTPEQAKVWLENRAPNRKIVRGDSRVNEYTRMMLCGHWVVADALKFDNTGKLIDGQHRLMAVIKADIPVKFFVVSGYEPDTILVLDSGKSRTIQQAVSLMGAVCNSRQFSIMSAMFTKVIAGQSQSTHMILTDRQLAFDLFNKYSEAIQFASKYQAPSNVACRRAHVRAAVARAYYYVDLDQLTRFVQILDGQPTENQVEKIPFYLRNVYIANKHKHDSCDRMLYLKTLHALDIFAKKKESFRIVEAKTQPFPLPDFDY